MSDKKGKSITFISLFLKVNSTPDFSQFGYRIVQTLGNNHFGGRTTYLATKIDTNKNVVIKQFQFAASDSDWLGYKGYQREIHILEQLEHSGIPKYLNSFETSDGFCMVQEYIKAPSLAISRSYEPEEIKNIAIKILEILIYLQNRIPAVIHRDLKPENILVDKTGKVYLVDFGFARLGGENLAMSSVTLGTLGFMPPEQLYNRQLTAATDLYSLGMTLICLLTKTKSSEIDTLIDEDNNVSFQHLLPQLSKRWLDWLHTLVQRNPKHRYQDAVEALEQLKPIYVFKQPEAKLSTSNLEFTANTYGEKLTKNIIVTNSVAKTLLEGNWQVAPHPNDPPHTPDSHDWISFSEPRFASNKVEVKITVDTSQLLADSNYQRKILLQTNSYPETQTIDVRVQTAEIVTPRIPYLRLTASIILSGMVFYLLLTTIRNNNDFIFLYFMLSFLIGAILGLLNNKGTVNLIEIVSSGIKGFFIVMGLVAGVQYIENSPTRDMQIYLVIAGVIGATIPILTLHIIKQTKLFLCKEKFNNLIVLSILLSVILLGISLAYLFSDYFFISYGFLAISKKIALLTIKVTIFYVTALTTYHIYKSQKTIKKYSNSKSQLIRP